VLIVGLPGGEPAAARGRRSRARPAGDIAALAGPAATSDRRCRDRRRRPVGACGAQPRRAWCRRLQGAAALHGERGRPRPAGNHPNRCASGCCGYGRPMRSPGFQHFDFFQQLLSSRSSVGRRYGYPLAVSCGQRSLGQGPGAAGGDRRTLRTRVDRRHLRRPIPRHRSAGSTSPGTAFLVLLPYTTSTAAEQVAAGWPSGARQGSVSDGERPLADVGVGRIAATRRGKPGQASPPDPRRRGGPARRPAQGRRRVVVRR